MLEWNYPELNEAPTRLPINVENPASFIDFVPQENKLLLLDDIFLGYHQHSNLSFNSDKIPFLSSIMHNVLLVSVKGK